MAKVGRSWVNPVKAWCASTDKCAMVGSQPIFAYASRLDQYSLSEMVASAGTDEDSRLK